MKNRFVEIAIGVFLLLLPAGLAQAIPLNITNSGMEGAGASRMTLHNVFAASGYYSVNFQWNPQKNFWYPTGYSAEFPSFKASEYYPLTLGSEWTYACSSGGTLTLSVTGAEMVCGIPCIRLDASDGSQTCWLSDNSGIYMAKYLFPEGYYNQWCPPMKIGPAQNYVGTNTLNPFYDAEIGSAYGVFASMNGWSQFAVKGVEDVTVPAGTFLDCFRATMLFSYTSSDGFSGVRIEEAWYAKGVGIVKRVNSQTSWLGGIIQSNSTEMYSLQSYSIAP